jgi:hypothetical protein
MVIIAFHSFPPVQAQLPQARITSLSRVGVRSGESVEVTLRGSDLEGVNQLWFDDPGLKAIRLKDLTFRVTCSPAVLLGQHDVRAVGTFGVSNPRTFVVGDRPEAAEVEPNNTPEKATSIVVNSVVDGEISAATEIDDFAFEGKKGQRLFFDLHAERIDSRLDATLRLLDPSNREIAESRDAFGADPFLDVTLPADGRYVIKVHDAVYAGSPDHFYRLTVHDGPHLDAILPLAARPGTPSAFTLLGRGLGPGAGLDPGSKVDGRTLERLTVTLDLPQGDAPGAFRSRLGNLPAGAAIDRSLEYALVRADPAGAVPVTSNLMAVGVAAWPIVVEKEPNSGESEPQRIVPPCDISGTFGVTGDVDVYRFEGKKGDVWLIEAIAERQGSPADPTILIQKVGAQGQPPQDLADADDLADAGAAARFNTQSVDASLRWQVPDDGPYQVVISDLYASQRGDPRLTYRLLIRREQPDYRLVLLPEGAKATDAVTIRAGGRTSAYVMAIRQGGFAGPIRVQATELPPGVSFAPVVIGPGQVLAPVVFEAAEDAATAVGVVGLVGHTRFGDRKEELGSVAGAATAGEDMVRHAQAGGMTWPPSTTTATIVPARLFRDFVAAVRAEPAPLTLTARPENLVVAQGHRLDLELTVARRAGFVEAVAVTAPELPPGITAAAVTIAKEAKSGILPLFVPKNVPPGTYSFVVRGSGPYPFSKDLKAKEKPTVTLTEPSNPITLTVKPAPVALAVDNRGGTLKQGQKLRIGVTVTRQNGFVGPLTLTLSAPASFKISAAPASLASNEARADLVIEAARDSPVGAAAGVVVRAVAEVRGEKVEVEEPVSVTVGK